MNNENPWQVLGISPDESPDKIRARYVALVKEHPPDRDPEAFGRVRAAYESVRDPRRLAAKRLFGPDPLSGLDELEALLRRPRRMPAGANAWLQALEEMSR